MLSKILFLSLAFITLNSFEPSNKEELPLILDSVSSNYLAGAKILKTAQEMIRDKVIIRGSCWDWINEAYTRAGYPKSKRKTVFSSKKGGPYANLSKLKPGDWIFHINHSYNNIGHSGMFVGWLDAKSNLALMISYQGERRKKPARYRPYDITHTYNIIRPKEDSNLKRVSAKEYARANKISIYEVIKRVNRGELKGESVKENGKKVTYILLEESKEIEKDKKDTNSTKELKDLNNTKDSNNYKELQDEIDNLKRRVRELEDIVKKCCKSR